jgi:carboxylate-amine ligase
LSTIDLNRGRLKFEQATDLTVAIEEEFAIVDPESLELVPRFEDLRGAARTDEVLSDAVAGELISTEIEIRSGRGADLHEAIAAQRERRQRLFALAARTGTALAATGTHPWASYLDQHVIDSDHYRRVEDDLRWVAWRNNTFAMHVHVGIKGADRAIKVCDRLREVLPELLAISASSPFLDGRDTGLASIRTQIFTRSFPRCGIPESFGDWASFAEFIGFLQRVRSIIEYTQVWWSVRPHLSFGTVEVRICDIQLTAGESDALASLVVACVAQAARDIDEGRQLQPLPGRMLEENLWRAIRYGLDGELLDLRRGEPYPAAEAAERLLKWTAPVRDELEIEVALPERNGTQRQRALREQGLSLHDIYALSVQEAAATYSGTVSTENPEVIE